MGMRFRIRRVPGTGFANKGQDCPRIGERVMELIDCSGRRPRKVSVGLEEDRRQGIGIMYRINWQPPCLSSVMFFKVSKAESRPSIVYLGSCCLKKPQVL
jgi:hypothetical protein